MAHKRRDGYWPDYHLGHARKKAFAVDFVKSYVDQNPPPEPVRESNRGRPRIYQYRHLVAACILMTFFNLTLRDTELEAQLWGLGSGSRSPDHSYLCKVYAKVDEEWLETALARIAAACIEESGIETGAMAMDSSGVETDRYETAERLDKKKGKEVEKREKTYLKWHITAVLGLQIILSCAMTASNVSDTSMLRPLLAKVAKIGRSFEGWLFNADRGYDSDANCELVFGAGMLPNIKQRKSVANSGNARNRGKPARRRAGELFDPEKYKRRGMIEGIFGAEEMAGHRLHCRYRKKEAQVRFGLLLGITWNICVLNRIRCSLELGHRPTMA